MLGVSLRKDAARVLLCDRRDPIRLIRGGRQQALNDEWPRPADEGSIMRHTNLMQHMKTAGLAAVAAIILPLAAQAADMPVKAPYYKAPPPPAAYNWSGCYLGAQAGYAWQRDRLHETTTATGLPSGFEPASPAKPDGFKGGGFLGCNWQGASPLVLGLEGDAEYADLKGSADYSFTGTPPDSYESRTRFQASIRARVGFAVDRALFYATAGVAFADIKHTYIDNPPPVVVESFSTTQTGWTAGGGVEYALSQNWIARVEYRYADFGHVTNVPVATFIGFTERHSITENAVRAGVSYKFDWGGPVVARY
jgi:outer membrane immunogenic protein